MQRADDRVGWKRLATLLRLLHGNFELAEEALQDAFIATLSQWPEQGIPQNPRAWLVSAGRFKAIDQLRKRRRRDASLDELARELDAPAEPDDVEEDGPAVKLTDVRMLDARGMNEALRLAEKIPPARYGSLEIRPVRELAEEGNAR